MTPEQLESLVLDSKDYGPLQEALAPLDEKERAKLSTAAQKLFNQLSRNKADQGASDRVKKFIAHRKGEMWKLWNAGETRRSILSLFGLGPLSAVKKRDVRVWDQEMPTLDRIIRDRRPDWLDEWIEHELEQEFSQIGFDTLVGWIRDGICRKPTSDGYYRLFASHLMRTGFYNRDEKVPPISAQLLAAPELLEDIEGLFRVEHIGFNTNSWLKKGAGDDHESWTDALVKLSADGHVQRDHLLDLAVDGLKLDIKQNQLSGFAGFYKAMTPTREEMLRHQQAYLALLCHPVGHVAKFALEMLSAIEKLGALDEEMVLREIPAVFAAGGKGNAIGAIKLLGRIAARQKTGHSEALGAVCEALRHVHADVQAAALDLLEKHAARLSEDQLQTIGEMESFVTASNRPRLAQLAGGKPAGAGEGAAAAKAPAAAKASVEPNGAKAPPQAPAADALTYRPISDDINEHDLLSDDNRIVPIASVDELIAALLHAMEIVDSPDEIERIVDAISRLSGERPADFEQSVAPLLHRLDHGGSGKGLNGGAGGAAVALVDLVYVWLSGKRRWLDRLIDQLNRPEGAFVPLAAHLRAIAERVARHESRSLLSAPTHKGGWIDPLAWIERLRSAQPDEAVRSMDFRLSLLRLAPDNRAEALAQAGSLADPLRRIASFALGGDEMPAREDRGHYAAWISAARCRAPLKDWSAEFAPLRLNDEWPDGLRPARYEWETSHSKHTYEGQTYKSPEFTIAVACEGGGGPAGTSRAAGLLSGVMQAVGGPIVTDWAELPSAALNRGIETTRRWWDSIQAPWATQWLAYNWPQNVAAACVKGTNSLVQRIDEDASGWTPSSGHFHVLFQQNRPWREPGHLLLCMGLIGKDADARGLAVDALIEGVEGRLFDPELFAATIGRLADGGWIKFNRLADALLLAIQVSPLHAVAIARGLQAWLPHLDLQQKNAFHILEALVEAQAITGEPLGEEARAALGKVGGSGKAAKLAKQLVRG